MHSLSDFVLAAAKKRERQPCYCKAHSGALERGVARACLAGRRRRRRPPRRAAERALDTEHSHTRAGPSESERTSSKADASRREAAESATHEDTIRARRPRESA